MIAMRYGCIPIAHATGGLKDTIVPHGKNSEGTGFLFTQANPEGVVEGLRSALEIYIKPTEWTGIQQRAMAVDFSWLRYAQEYANLYRSLIDTSR
jgi:starch synthase